MEITFINGTKSQQDAVRTVAHNLLHLPFDAMALNWTIEFVADADPDEHNEFAATEYTYGSNTAVTRIAAIAPNWAEPWTGVKFFHEVIAHELGHALYASLPKTRRVAIAQMFGALSDSLAELQPVGSNWEDRYIEGIAETFKDAFLPRRFRRYSTRANRRISIARYPEFRALFRLATEEASEVGDEEGGIAVPAYNLDVYHVGKGSQVGSIPVYASKFAAHSAVTFKQPFGIGLLDYSTADYAAHATTLGMIYSTYLAQSGTGILMLPPGTNLRGSIDLPQENAFFGPSDEAVPPSGLQAQEGFEGIFDYFDLPPESYQDEDGRLGSVEVSIAFAYLDPSTGHWVQFGIIDGIVMGFITNFPGDTENSTWRIIKGYGGDLDQSPAWSDPPIGTLSLNENVPLSAPTIETCGGEMVQVRVLAEVQLTTAPSRQDAIATIQPRLPSFQLETPAYSCGGERVPIDVPLGRVAPGGERGGIVPSESRIVGGKIG